MSLPLDPPVPGSNLDLGPHHRVVWRAADRSVNTVQINYKTRPMLAVKKDSADFITGLCFKLFLCLWAFLAHLKKSRKKNLQEFCHRKNWIFFTYLLALLSVAWWSPQKLPVLGWKESAPAMYCTFMTSWDFLLELTLVISSMSKSPVVCYGVKLPGVRS